jgi:hypothetical protein
VSLSSGLIVVDDGGSSTCVITKNGREQFPSVKGFYGNRNLTEANGKYDYIVDYKGQRYVMGTLAKYDCKYPYRCTQKQSATISLIYQHLSQFINLDTQAII